MRNRLIEILSQVIILLSDCGWPDKSEWFAEVRDALKKPCCGYPQCLVTALAISVACPH